MRGVCRHHYPLEEDCRFCDAKATPKNMTPETLKDVTPEFVKPELPPCLIRYVTMGIYKLNTGEKFWTVDHCQNREQADRELETYIPGTGRIFEIPAEAK